MLGDESCSEVAIRAARVEPVNVTAARLDDEPTVMDCPSNFNNAVWAAVPMVIDAVASSVIVLAVVGITPTGTPNVMVGDAMAAELENSLVQF